jgi:hypothetical protein
VLLLACIALLAVMQLRREWVVYRAGEAVDRQSLEMARGDLRPVQLAQPIALDAPARALVYQALFTARETAYVRGPAGRAALLSQAMRAADAAAQRRPFWGEALTVKAFVASLRDGAASPAVVQNLVESYRAAPYLRQAAGWRVRQSFLSWDSLPAATREAVLREAIWLVRLDVSETEAVFDSARESGAYRPLMSRWWAVRLSDADLAAWRRPR